MHGTTGEIAFDEATVTVKTFADKNVEVTTLGPEPGEHGGGDRRVILSWLTAIRQRDPTLITTGVEASLATHAIAFAAERARLERVIVDPAAVLRACGWPPDAP